MCTRCNKYIPIKDYTAHAAARNCQPDIPARKSNGDGRVEFIVNRKELIEEMQKKLKNNEEEDLNKQRMARKQEEIGKKKLEPPRQEYEKKRNEEQRSYVGRSSENVKKQEEVKKKPDKFSNHREKYTPKSKEPIISKRVQMTDKSRPKPEEMSRAPIIKPDISEDERIARELAEQFDRDMALEFSQNIQDIPDLVSNSSYIYPSSYEPRYDPEQDSRLAREMIERDEIEIARQKRSLNPKSGQPKRPNIPEDVSAYQQNQPRNYQDYRHQSERYQAYDQRNVHEEGYSQVRGIPQTGGLDEITEDEQMLNAAILESLQSKK